MDMSTVSRIILLISTLYPSLLFDTHFQRRTSWRTKAKKTTVSPPYILIDLY
jgi:hypothetical protein